jgi:hypothetical protein
MEDSPLSSRTSAFFIAAEEPVLSEAEGISVSTAAERHLMQHTLILHVWPTDRQQHSELRTCYDAPRGGFHLLLFQVP